MLGSLWLLTADICSLVDLELRVCSQCTSKSWFLWRLQGRIWPSLLLSLAEGNPSGSLAGRFAPASASMSVGCAVSCEINHIELRPILPWCDVILAVYISSYIYVQVRSHSEVLDKDSSGVLEGVGKDFSGVLGKGVQSITGNKLFSQH